MRKIVNNLFETLIEEISDLHTKEKFMNKHQKQYQIYHTIFRYTLPHRRKVSRIGENVFWSAKEQVINFCLIKFYFNLIFRVISTK